MTRQTRCTGGTTPEACNREPTGVREGEPMCAEHMRIWDDIFSFTQKNPARSGYPKCAVSVTPRAGTGAGDPGTFNVEQNYKRAGTSSRAASKAADRARVGKTHMRILEALAEREGAPEDMVERLELNLLTARPRMSDLRKLGYVENTGRTRPTDAGDDADIMCITDLGRSVLEQLREAA